jgi:hypothetical protein
MAKANTRQNLAPALTVPSKAASKALSGGETGGRLIQRRWRKPRTQARPFTPSSAYIANHKKRDRTSIDTVWYMLKKAPDGKITYQ